MGPTQTVGPTANERAATAAIAAAYLGSHQVKAAAAGDVVRSIGDALAELLRPPAFFHGIPLSAMAVPRDPRQSVFPGYIICQECGKPFAVLRTHLTRIHHVEPAQYFRKWNLPDNYPLTAPDYARTRSALAKAFDLGHARARSIAAATTPRAPARTTP